MCREILRLTKLIMDSHVQYRLGNVDAFQVRCLPMFDEQHTVAYVLKVPMQYLYDLNLYKFMKGNGTLDLVCLLFLKIAMK